MAQPDPEGGSASLDWETIYPGTFSGVTPDYSGVPQNYFGGVNRHPIISPISTDKYGNRLQWDGTQWIPLAPSSYFATRGPILPLPTLRYWGGGASPTDVSVAPNPILTQTNPTSPTDFVYPDAFLRNAALRGTQGPIVYKTVPTHPVPPTNPVPPTSPPTHGNTGGGNWSGYVGGGVRRPPGVLLPPPPSPPPRKTQLDLALEDLDNALGQGWSAGFTRQNGIDPIRFYARAFPNDPVHIQVEKAKRAAVNDARWHPDELADWQMKHGNVPPPPEQWRTWWYMNQSGGPNFNAGRGVDPYGVH